MTTFDSILIAAFIGGVTLYLINQVSPISEDNYKIIGYGAATGAAVQLAVRLTGVS